MLIFDSPPALAMSDAYVIAPQVDGVILVVRAGVTHRHRAKETKEAFERLGVRVLGVVWNAAETVGGYDYYRYYNDSKDSDFEPPPKKTRAKAAVKTPVVEVKQSPWDDLKPAAEIESPVVEVKPSPWDDLRPRPTPPPVDKPWLRQVPQPPAPTPPPVADAVAGKTAYRGYCIKCKTSREFEGVSARLKSGRLAAQGICPVCGTKITRMISEPTNEAASGVSS